MEGNVDVKNKRIVPIMVIVVLINLFKKGLWDGNADLLKEEVLSV